MDPRGLLAVLSEPRRLRIVELLAASPRTVGELAALLGALQPQTTKHLQALEAAGLVTVHRLGRRKVAALERDALRSVADWLQSLSIAHPSESVLDQYQRAIEVEQERLGDGGVADRVFRIDREFAASQAALWRAWTTEDGVRQWWAPQHFEVADCVVEPVVGGRLQVVLAEGDGARYVAVGRFLEVRPDRELVFAFAPLDGNGEPLFDARYRITIDPTAQGTAVGVEIRVRATNVAAAPAIAGLELGWSQLLDKLGEVVGG